MKKLQVRAIVEGYVDYEIVVEDNATADKMYDQAYDEMPTGGFESYCIETDLESALEDAEEIDEEED
jgi:hypothetical protein